MHTGFLAIYRYAGCNADLQPLPQALAGGVLAEQRYPRDTDDLLEYAGQL